MNELDSMFHQAQALISYASSQGIDITQYCNCGQFAYQGRYIRFWSGSFSTIKYMYQGGIQQIPSIFKGSESCFRQMYSETGEVETVEQAFQLMQAWLIDSLEIDHLPGRSIKSQGI